MVSEAMILEFLRAWHKAQEDEGAYVYPDDVAMRAGLGAVFAQARRELAHEALKSPVDRWDPRLDVVERAAPFMRQCGPCDYGLPMACQCPREDFRPVVVMLVEEIERLRKLAQERSR